MDLPGEAGTIMHKMEDMKAVELATVSFGQSFQITPIQLATTVSSIINGGNRITPHFAVMTGDSEQAEFIRFSYPVKEHIVSEETSATMRMILEQVVAEGSGKNGKVEGQRVGRRRQARPCQEEPEGILRPLWDLHRQMTRRCLLCVLSITPREFITEDRLRRLWCGSFLKIFFLI